MNKSSSPRLGLILTVLCAALAATPAFAHGGRGHNHDVPPPGHHQHRHYSDHHRTVVVVARPRCHAGHRHCGHHHHGCHHPVARIATIVGVHALLHY